MHPRVSLKHNLASQLSPVPYHCGPAIEITQRNGALSEDASKYS